MAKKRFTRTMPIRNTIHYHGVITADDIKRKFKIPAQAQITMTVPGGGNWSGMSIVMGEDFPHLTVTWDTNP
jgi:hypothetical protein